MGLTPWHYRRDVAPDRRHHRGKGPQTDERHRRPQAIVDEIIAANAKNVAEFQAGNDKALNALVGQIMKASSKGKANPQQVNELLRAKLAC